MDMDPIPRKMQMKKVAGFQSFFTFTLAFLDELSGFRRMNLGIMASQNEVSASELAARAPPCLYNKGVCDIKG